ncbi:hypothetical protein CIB48_g12128 [Xylaria polymorpha]|nr:hypothetical protein CIB48_g12128 [Xylaria polymorpha]
MCGKGTSTASFDPSTDSLLKRKRSGDVFKSLPDNRLCIRDEDKAGSNNELTIEARRYTESLHDFTVYLSTQSDKTGLSWAA